MPRAKKAAAAPQTESIGLDKLNIQVLQIGIVGDSSLICHKWSETAIKQILDKQMKTVAATAPKTAKDPVRDYLESLYPFGDGMYGFPAAAFKEAAVSACRQTDMAMTQAKGLFRVRYEYVPILLGEPRMRRDTVRLESGVADIRFRGEFEEWATMLKVDFNASVISKEQLVNLFNLGGFAVGVGDWRPGSPKGKTGNHGTFHVATADEFEEIQAAWEARFPNGVKAARDEYAAQVGIAADAGIAIGPEAGE